MHPNGIAPIKSKIFAHPRLIVVFGVVPSRSHHLIFVQRKESTKENMSADRAGACPQAPRMKERKDHVCCEPVILEELLTPFWRGVCVCARDKTFANSVFFHALLMKTAYHMCTGPWWHRASEAAHHADRHFYAPALDVFVTKCAWFHPRCCALITPFTPHT